jgi:hypothetical protein
MPQELKTEIKQLSNVGSAPKEIISAIRQATDHPVTAQDVYNIHRKLRLENLAGLSPTESLLAILKDSNYVFNYKTDQIEHLTHLFFVHPQSILLLK